MKKNIILLICLIVFSIFLSFFVHSVLINYLNNGLTTENLNFTGNQNITRQFDIPLIANVTSSFINFTGVNNNISNCFQETATSSTSCGGLSTGSYFSDNSSNPFLYYYVNYSKPFGSFNATWQTVFGFDGANFYFKNYSLPDSCFSYNSNLLSLRFISHEGSGANTNFAYGQCFNGAWINVTDISITASGGSGTESFGGGRDTRWYDANYATGTSGYSGGLWGSCASSSDNCVYHQIVEEAILWNINYYPINVSLIINNTNAWNYTGSFNQSNNKTLDLSSYFNQILNGSTCSGGIVNGSNCTINITIHSDTPGNLSLSDIQINWKEYTKPNLTIDQPNGTYNNITYIPINYTAVDNYLIDTCYYNITIGATLDTANTIIPNCLNTTANLHFGDGIYSVNMCVNDTSNNLNCSSKLFTVTNYIPVPSSPGGGGGGTTEGTKIPVIGLNPINSTYTSLEREALYSVINDLCSESLRQGALAVVDYSSQCSLSQDILNTARDKMINYGFDIKLVDLPYFYLEYKQGQLFQGFEDGKTVEKYNLFASALGLPFLLQLLPPSVDTPVIIFEANGLNRTVSYTVTSNKPIKSCSVITDQVPINCTVSNSTIRVFYNIEKTNFISQIFQGRIAVTTDASQDKIEVRPISVTFRVYNLGYDLFDGFPVYFGIIILLVLIIGGGVFVYRRYFKKRKAKGLNINKYLNYS